MISIFGHTENEEEEAVAVILYAGFALKIRNSNIPLVVYLCGLTMRVLFIKSVDDSKDELLFEMYDKYCTKPDDIKGHEPFFTTSLTLQK